MSRVCFATITIRPRDGGAGSVRELGEFYAVWGKGVTIGSSAQCDVSLPGLAPIAAVALAASNHKLLYLAGSPGFAAACNFDGRDLPGGDTRIDYFPFEIGPYELNFGESSR